MTVTLEQGLAFYGDPGHEREGELNDWNGGRGLSFVGFRSAESGIRESMGEPQQLSGGELNATLTSEVVRIQPAKWSLDQLA